MPSRNYSKRTLKLLWGLSQARCAYPECRELLIAHATDEDRAAVLGEAAHVIAFSDLGPRPHSEMSEEERNDYENLILLCRNHHALIDAQPHTFAPDEVRGWKASHEAWVRDVFAREVAAIGFAELEVVTQTLLGPFVPRESDFQVLHQEEKLRRNGLSQNVSMLLKIGELRAKDVRDFVDHVAALDPDFPSRLTKGFVDEYRRHREFGELGDELFESLRDFAADRKSVV